MPLAFVTATDPTIGSIDWDLPPVVSEYLATLTDSQKMAILNEMKENIAFMAHVLCYTFALKDSREAREVVYRSQIAIADRLKELHEASAKNPGS